MLEPMLRDAQLQALGGIFGGSRFECRWRIHFNAADDAFAAFGSSYKSNAHKKGPPFGEPFLVLRMVPAPGVEPGTY